MAEQKKKTEKVETPFKTVSKNLPFFPDKENPDKNIFVGMFRNRVILGDDPDNKENIPACIFADIETGEEIFIVEYYAIKKAVDTAKAEYPDSFNDIVFRFEFKGKTEANGKPFNQFDTGYCTLEEYENFKK